MESHAAALRDPGDDCVHLSVQRSQHAFVVRADVQAEVEAAGHDREAVPSGVGVKAPDGAGHRDTAFVMLGPEGLHGHGEFRAGHRRIPPETAGQADMVVRTLDAGVGVAEIAGNSGADADRLAGFHQAGRLLDMQFQIGFYQCGIEVTVPRRQRRRVAAAFGDVFGQGAPGVDAPHVERPVRQGTERAPAADVGNLEPDAFLGADAHDGEVAGWGDAALAERGDRGEAGDNPGGAIEVAAVRH